MGEYERSYPEAPTQEEIEQGYAPSTISGKPFIKFLFWIFAGLAITYAIGFGSWKALETIERTQQARYQRMAARQPAEFTGPRLQPSPGHPTLDTEDMAKQRVIYRDQMRSMKLWADNPQSPESFGHATISDQVVASAATAIADWSKAQQQSGGQQKAEQPQQPAQPQPSTPE